MVRYLSITKEMFVIVKNVLNGKQLAGGSKKYMDKQKEKCQSCGKKVNKEDLSPKWIYFKICKKCIERMDKKFGGLLK